MQATDEEIIKIYLEKSPEDYCCIFIMSLLSDGGDIELLHKAFYCLEKRYKHQIVMPDTYTFQYRVEEMEQLWRLAYGRHEKYSQEYIDSYNNCLKRIKGENENELSI